MEQELTCEEIDRRVRSLKHRIAEMQARFPAKNEPVKPKVISEKKPLTEMELLRQKMRGG